jgi:molybdopterin converting factor small subunit
MSKRHCMFQYATAYRYLSTKIYEDTDLITWEEALELWNKYRPQVIQELEDDYSRPEMVIWTGCESSTSYSNDTFHVNEETPVRDGEFVEVITRVIDPNKVSMGEPS